jgi:putative transposase
MELYHVLNRGVEKRKIFMDKMDHARFVHDLYEFNKPQAAGNAYRRFQKQGAMMDLRGPSFSRKLVDIHAWCLMGNHYHLLLSERIEGGLSLFLMRLNVGYAKYFNEKYKRSGTLFQGRTKKILIATDAHYLHILHYIHLNPLDFRKETNAWRERTISGTAGALKHLEEYRWSSYQDYCGIRNFPSILTTGALADPGEAYRAQVAAYLKDLDIESVRPLTLE